MRGLRLPDEVAKRDKRHPFSDEQLRAIFNAPLYRGCLDGERGYAKPGLERPRNARFWVPLIALHKQLAWCRSNTGKQLDCAMGNLFRACSQWIDFEGITVVYSGNKSFHIHIVFSTAHAKAQGITQNIRDGLNLHWHRLCGRSLGALAGPCACGLCLVHGRERSRCVPRRFGYRSLP